MLAVHAAPGGDGLARALGVVVDGWRRVGHRAGASNPVRKKPGPTSIVLLLWPRAGRIDVLLQAGAGGLRRRARCAN